ncbi:hypothetical protein [Parafrankia sp. EUN1f]|uniref:hypothetical protein n=1 Tax=Parafrankia sp. EUN1f TaxID=102897 RepID=UPI0001C45A6A|nr:hypothetical protein [Parafrankia sp. EUN1f]EFC82756.1 extracellular repeat protein, HAF family [Parafrankia sp. EUN1f]
MVSSPIPAGGQASPVRRDRHTRRAALGTGLVTLVGGAVASAPTASAVTAAQPRPQVTVTDLGAPDLLQTSIIPRIVNNRGTVAAYGAIGGTQPLQAFTWTAGTITRLEAPTADPGVFSFPVGLNTAGAVAGYTTVGGTLHSLFWPAGSTTPTDISAPGGNSHPLALNDAGQVLLVEEGRPALWDNGVRTVIAPFPETTAVGLNAAGQVFGTGRQGDQPDRAFVWSPSGTVDVGPFGSTTTVTGLNDRGQLVGYGAVASAGQRTHGFVWTPAAGGRPAKLTDIGTLAGLETEAHAVNNAGVVVGRSATPTGWHAVSWANGRLTDLGVLVRGKPSQALALNETGDVVGWGTAADNRQHAALWRGGRAIDLGLPAGFVLTYAIDVNDDGLVLGYGIHENGSVHGFVWSVTR